MKRNWMRILACVTVTFALLLALAGCGSAESGDTDAGGDAGQAKEGNRYFSELDWYNMPSGDTLTMLTHYEAYRQSGANSGCSAILGTLDWFGLRGDLKEDDVAKLTDATDTKAELSLSDAASVYRNLGKQGVTGKWKIITSSDEPGTTLDSEWIQKELKAGHPVMVKWNSFGCHWQTIIGYENMGTEYTVDDVCIMMDTLDTTDGKDDGYYIEPFQRMLFGLCTEPGKDAGSLQFLCAYPQEWTWEQETGEGPAPDETNVGVFTDENKIPYGNAAEDIRKSYGKELKEGLIEVGENGMAGPATDIYYHAFDHENSPYYIFHDFYNMEDSDTLHMLTHFKTLQQATEYSCGPAAAAMVMNWYGKLEDETDVSLMQARQEGRMEATELKGMKQVFKYMNRDHGQDWVWVSTTDLDDPEGEKSYVTDYCLQAGDGEEQHSLIPYLLKNDIPVMIGWDEWGGHWSVIIGYDDMGTDETADDVLIMADPYDSTDHDQDGYFVDSYERLVRGYFSDFEKKCRHNDFLAAFPQEGHEEVIETLQIRH